MLLGDHQVARQRELAPATQRSPLHRCDDRHGTMLQRIHRGAHVQHLLRTNGLFGERVEVAEIPSGHEHVGPLARDDDRSHLLIRGGALDEGFELVRRFARNGVLAARAIDDGYACFPAPLHADPLLTHDTPRRRVRVLSSSTTADMRDTAWRRPCPLRFTTKRSA